MATEYKDLGKCSNDLFSKLFVGKDSNKSKFLFSNSDGNVNFETALQKRCCGDKKILAGTFKGTYKYAGDFVLHPEISYEGNSCGMSKVSLTSKPEIEGDFSLTGIASYQKNGCVDNGFTGKANILHKNASFNVSLLYPTAKDTNVTLKTDLSLVDLVENWSLGFSGEGSLVEGKPAYSKVGAKIHFQKERNFQVTSFYDKEKDTKTTCGFNVCYAKDTTDFGFKYSFEKKHPVTVEPEEETEETEVKPSCPHVIGIAVQFNNASLGGKMKVKVNSKAVVGVAYNTKLSDTVTLNLAAECPNVLNCEGSCCKFGVNLDFDL